MNHKLPHMRVLLASFLVLVLSISLHADEIPHARAYFDWAQSAIAQNRDNLPAITQAANAIAPLLIDGKDLGVRDASLAAELGSRAGGFVFYRSQPGKEGDVIIYGIASQPAAESSIQSHLEKSIADMHALKKQGSVVVAIASIAQLRAHDLLEDAQKSCDHLLDNFAPAADGLSRTRDDKPIVPTIPVANAITAWALQAELYAAFTRAGKTPSMFQSVAIPTGKARNNHLLTHRFQDDVQLQPFPEGRLGQAYLQGVSKLLNDVGTISWPAMIRTTDHLFEVLADGGTAYIYVTAHYPPHHFGDKLALDPGVLTLLNPRGKGAVRPVAGQADAILALGYCMPPYSSFFGKRETFDNAGRGTAWVITRYDTMDSDLGPKDVLVDQHWAKGDAIVQIPGYDVNVFPASGIITETIAWAVIAQVSQEWQDHQASRKVPAGAAK